MTEQESNVQIIPPSVSKWGGIIVLTALDCILAECFTGKSYTYRVYNTKTGASGYLCHKKNPVSESERMAMLEEFISSDEKTGIKPTTEHPANKNLNEKVSNEKLTEDLTYIFETLLPKHGYSLRTEQLELAKDILKALYRRMVSLSEAGVGIGKTHAYLIASVIIKYGNVNDFWLRSNYPDMLYAAKMPIVVATSSIALQKAIVRDYIPEISKILMEYAVIAKPVSCVVRKGKDHFVCEKRLNAFCKQCTDNNDNNVKKLIEPLFEGNYSIDLDEIDFLTPYIKRRINVNSHCGINCRFRDSCRYKAYIENAKSDKHDFQISNHNYLLADVMRRAKGQSPLLPNYQAIVIDEAHKFLQAARQMYGMTLSSRILSSIAKNVRRFVFEQGESTADLWKDTKKLKKQSEGLFELLIKNIPDGDSDDDTERFKTNIDATAARYLQVIKAILERLLDGLRERNILPKHESVYTHTLYSIEKLIEHIATFKNCDDIIYWLERSKIKSVEETLLCAIPKHLGEFLHNDLWGKGVPIILTSGTLSASCQGHSDFSHIKQSFGLNKLRPNIITESSRPSPFDYRNNGLIYVSKNVPFPDSRNSRYIEALADEMEQLILAAHGHAVALFTSYRAMYAVFDLLGKRGLSFPLFKLERGKIKTIDQFRQSGNGVLLATGSLWEGIDLPGDILSLLIIVKLPFAVPDPISEYEMIQYGGREKYKDAVIIPEMQVKLKQGSGRPFRNETDVAVIAICDIRAYYGETFHKATIRALPPCPTTDSIDDVRQFIKEKKPIEYFGGTLNNSEATI